MSISKFEERCCFLYVLHNSDDFQIYFCTELHCKKFFEMVNTITEEKGRATEEGDCESDSLEPFCPLFCPNSSHCIAIR
ncbi:Mitogen-activated protein kinase kinase kinase 5 [Camelus dromedarius]|uniref:Mitogen-activated protein kinase kinase kinase 5 n=1 Tax=Camelus dromedarius TaxID=9838 RepID=A0A5N4DXG2_CAMDR|nr:Mitogen-activated protein kinase kinase kinase 5 [Camelus dromedarius]